MPSRTVEVAATDLHGYIKRLPRLLAENLTIYVTGTAAIQGIEICCLYGPGSLTISVTDGAEVTVYIQVMVADCTVPVTIEGLKLIGDNSGGGSILSVNHTSYLALRNCVFDREHDINKGGATAYNGSHILLEQCQFAHCNPAIISQTGSDVSAFNCTGANNITGISARGGIVLLMGTTPDLLGGSANSKSGGLIVKSDGTLL